MGDFNGLGDSLLFWDNIYQYMVTIYDTLVNQFSSGPVNVKLVKINESLPLHKDLKYGQQLVYHLVNICIFTSNKIQHFNKKCGSRHHI